MRRKCGIPSVTCSKHRGILIPNTNNNIPRCLLYVSVVKNEKKKRHAWAQGFCTNNKNPQTRFRQRRLQNGRRRPTRASSERAGINKHRTNETNINHHVWFERPAINAGLWTWWFMFVSFGPGVSVQTTKTRKLVSASGGSKTGAAGQRERLRNERELTNIGQTKQT